MRDEDHTYRKGDCAANGPVLLLSVAGQAEEAADRPAAGAARRHLDAIISRLHAIIPDLMPYPYADAYPILNAYHGVEYKKLTGRTEALVSEYIKPANVARVVARVAGRPVIAFGGRARRTCCAACITPLMVGRHPSSLNRITNAQARGDTPSERAASRYDVASAGLLRSLRAIDPDLAQ